VGALTWSALARREVWGLAAGDAAAFLVFAALGHRDHGETSSVVSVVGTALPFIAGWFLVAPWAGAYNIGRGAPLKTVLVRTEVAWVCAWPVTLLIRAAALHRSIPLTFFVVTLLFNSVILLGWRSVYWLLSRGAGVRAAGRPDRVH
jgi:hypothetical protein